MIDLTDNPGGHDPTTVNHNPSTSILIRRPPSASTRPADVDSFPVERLVEIGDRLHLIVENASFASLENARQIVTEVVADVDPIDLRLVTNELLTNAIEHGNGSRVDLHIRRQAERVVLRMQNDCADETDFGASSQRATPDANSGHAQRGRGLDMVEHICGDLAVQYAAGRVQVSASLPIPFRRDSEIDGR